jgi:O-6-methylguanine DNA methyltransferase
MKSFAEKVRDIVRTIPAGKTMTYKQVATKAGNAKAARAVGAVMRANFDDTVPCHRVVKSDGSLGNYNRGGTLKKRELLKHEGVFKTCYL